MLFSCVQEKSFGVAYYGQNSTILHRNQYCRFLLSCKAGFSKHWRGNGTVDIAALVGVYNLQLSFPFYVEAAGKIGTLKFYTSSDLPPINWQVAQQLTKPFIAPITIPLTLDFLIGSLNDLLLDSSQNLQLNRPIYLRKHSLVPTFFIH